MDIVVNVVNQELRVATNLRCLPHKSQQYYRFVFNLPSEWDGLTTFAQFSQGGSGYNTYLDANDSVYLPSEIGAGKCFLILYGTGSGVKATTNCLTLTINDNHFVENAESTAITQSLYDQLVDIVRDSSHAVVVATSTSGMTDHSTIYVYMGSQSGYTQGNMYYWNGSAWTSIGPYYESPDTALSTSSTNTVQNKVVAAAINNILNNVATLAEIQTYIP